VWLIRFRALQAWCAGTETSAWLGSEDGRSQGACELAASFALNGDWQFDADDFHSAVHTLTEGRPSSIL
jgi:hypothetical protein